MEVKAGGHFTENRAFGHVRLAKTMISLSRTLIRVSVYFSTCHKSVVQNGVQSQLSLQYYTCQNVRFPQMTNNGILPKNGLNGH